MNFYFKFLLFSLVVCLFSYYYLFQVNFTDSFVNPTLRAYTDVHQYFHPVRTWRDVYVDAVDSFTIYSTNILWFFFDFLPNSYHTAYGWYVYLSELTLDGIITSAYSRLCMVPKLFQVWLLSHFQCQRQKTFLFFWSYPQSYYCTWYNQHYDQPRELSTLDFYLLGLIGGPFLLASAYLFLTYQMKMRPVRPWEDIAHFFRRCSYGTEYHLNLDFEHVRSVFRTTVIPTRKPVRNHGHGTCAASRSTATAFIHSVSQALGLEAWIYQMSRNDQEKGHKGVRTPFWTKDLTVAPRSDPMLPNSAIVMTDVDYYVDMNRWLTSHFRPHFFYTLQPCTAGKVAEDYSYSFKDNFVHYYVTGCSTPYIHRVWNYQVDNVSVSNSILGVPIARATYHVERRTAGGDHELVMLFPLRRWSWWNAWIAKVFIGETPLEYFSPKVGIYNRVITHSRVDDGSEPDIMVSTALEGSCSSVSVRGRLDEELHNISELAHTKLSYPTVQMALSGNGINDSAGSKILTRFHQEKVLGGARKAVTPAVFNYQFPSRPRYDPDAKPSLQV